MSRQRQSGEDRQPSTRSPRIETKTESCYQGFSLDNCVTFQVTGAKSSETATAVGGRQPTKTLYWRVQSTLGGKSLLLATSFDLLMPFTSKCGVLISEPATVVRGGLPTKTIARGSILVENSYQLMALILECLYQTVLETGDMSQQRESGEDRQLKPISSLVHRPWKTLANY